MLHAQSWLKKKDRKELGTKELNKLKKKKKHSFSIIPVNGVENALSEHVRK
jgi:hypothetical protein